MGDRLDKRLLSDRVKSLEKERQRQRQEIEEKKAEIRKGLGNGVHTIQSKFSSKQSSVDDTLRAQTIGLVTKEQYRQTREDLEKEDRLRRMRESESDQLEAQKAAREKKKRKRKAGQLLSFDMDEDGCDDDEELVLDTAAPQKVAKAASADGAANAGGGGGGGGVLKNPDVDTSFLPDAERERREQELRRELVDQWYAEQERQKAMPLEVTYSYWDGRGHRAKATLPRGSTVLQFLQKVQREFRELRGVSADQLIFVKEDYILPHHLTFHELISTKARGKSGPLFRFDVHDDVRLLADARRESQESHPGKVCERRWYELNRHIHPQNRWSIFDITDAQQQAEKKKTGR